MNPQEKIDQIRKNIKDSLAEMSRIAVENDLEYVTFNGPNGWRTDEVLTRARAIDIMTSYGWEESKESYTDEDLEDAFYSETGLERKIGDWISSSDLC